MQLFEFGRPAEISSRSIKASEENERPRGFYLIQNAPREILRCNYTVFTAKDMGLLRSSIYRSNITHILKKSFVIDVNKTLYTFFRYFKSS